MPTNCQASRRPELRQGVQAPAGDSTELAELLVRTTRRVRQSSMAELGPIGLTGAQARVVGYLEHLGHPARMADIAAALEVVPRSATSIVDDLERAGLVIRAVDPRDRRSILVSLTVKGALLHDRIAQARSRTAETIFSALSPLERAELTRLLAMLCGPCCGPRDTRGGSVGAAQGHSHSNKGD